MKTLARKSPSGKAAIVQASSAIVGTVLVGALTQIVIAVPGCLPGWFAVPNLPTTHSDDYLLFLQHTDRDSVHALILNVSRVSETFNDPIDLAFIVP